MSPLEQAKVTVVIPTFNRADLLAVSLASVLAQDTEGMAVLVHDNASPDNTADVVAEIDDARVEYRVNDDNVGFFRNWKMGLEAVRSPYVAFLQDDDLWRPNFLTPAVDALDSSPTISAAFSDVELIDEDDRVLGTRETTLPAGRFEGLDYMERVVNGENVIIDSSAMVMRTDVLRRVGGFDLPHMTHDVIFNYQFRLAAEHDLVRLPEPLVAMRMHGGQIHHATEGGVAAIGMVAERMDAAAMLLRSNRSADPDYRRWLADRLVWLGRLRSQYTAEEAPALTASAADRLSLAVEDITAAVPEGRSIAMVGDDLLYDERLLAHARLRPFPQTEGVFAGPPATSADAMVELDRCIDEGVDAVAVAWPSFWWLDFYHEFRTAVGAHESLVDNSRVVVYRLER